MLLYRKLAGLVIQLRVESNDYKLQCLLITLKLHQYTKTY